MNNADKTIIILGGGGHAAVVIEIARICGFEPVAVYDDREDCLGKSVSGVAIKGRISDLPAELSGNACIAIGNNQVRKTIAGRLAAMTWPVLMHRAACVSALAKVGQGTVICAGAVVQPNAVIGDFAIINVGACVDHDSQIGDFCHIATHACAGAGTVVGEGVQAGPGVIMKAFSRIEPWSVIC